MKQQLTARWEAFSRKEKNILLVLALAMLGLLLYAFVWLPVQQGRERLTQDIPMQQSKLLLMRSQAADVERLRRQHKQLHATANGLKAAVEVSAKFHGLTPRYPVADKGGDPLKLEVALSQVSFATWIKWVESLQSQNHVRVLSCHITPDGAAGQIQVEAVFAAAE